MECVCACVCVCVRAYGGGGGIYSVSRSVHCVIFSFFRVFQFSKTVFLAMIKEIRMVLVKWLGTVIEDRLPSRHSEGEGGTG